MCDTTEQKTGRRAWVGVPPLATPSQNGAAMYADVIQLLPEESPNELPAELHGLVCGALSVGMVVDEARWQELAGLASAEVALENADAVLFALLRGSQSLDADDFTFEPLLPDDETLLRERVVALAAWCGGFLLSFAIANPDHVLLSEEVASALSDLEEVVEVDTEVTGDEDEEWHFTEVKEHVKTAALLIREEMRDAEET